jgi:PAS domain S-box-containing protein
MGGQSVPGAEMTAVINPGFNSLRAIYLRMGSFRDLSRWLDDGLDEMAASAHAGFALRMLIMLGVAALASRVLTPSVCADWAILVGGLEAWGWFATRAQFHHQRIGLGTRLHHLINVAITTSAWTSIAWMMWASGTREGALCAVVLWLSVVFFAQSHAYQSPAGFVAAGVVPALCMLAGLAVTPNTTGLDLIPVWGTLFLAVTFAGDGVRRMLSARKLYLQAEAQTRESEARYRMLANNITDVISQQGIDGSRGYISPSIERALGYTPEFLLTTPNYTFLHEDDHERVRDAVAKLQQPGDEIVMEYRVIRADGTITWAETSFRVAEGGDGILQVVSISRVVDARKAMERELIEARERAETAAAAKSDFLANMTHELRTPLNAIIGFAGILRASPALNAEDARHAHLIREASSTLLEIVNSVLDFSKLEAGAVELDPQPFDPLAEAESVAAMVGEQAEAKGLTLQVLADGDMSPLVGDGPRLRQVLLNFLSNAVKFTSAGAVTVNLSQQGDGDTRILRVAVRDSGIGVPQNQISHLFERFTQGDVSVSRKFGGTGLGLAICKRTIDMMGGVIGADSVEGEGSTFWFEVTLPVCHGDIAAPHAEPEATDLDRPVRLLLVEDVAVNRELVQTLLRPFDIDIDTACDGVEAIHAVERGAYDVILMDVQMPVMDGLTASHRIRASGCTTPIVAMTANVLPEQVRKCREAGMNDHLGKPINPQRLLEVIGQWSAPGAGEAAALDAQQVSA